MPQLDLVLVCQSEELFGVGERRVSVLGWELAMRDHQPREPKREVGFVIEPGEALLGFE